MLRSVFDEAGLNQELEKIKQEQQAEDFWSDMAKVKANGKKQKEIEGKLNKIKELVSLFEDIQFECEYLQLEEDESLISSIDQKLKKLYEGIEETTLSTLLNAPYDSNNAIISLHAGAGGTEAQDWVSMLYRMYLRYCEREGFKVEELDLLDGDEAGIKSVTFSVEGEKAYGYLKAEKGVHRLVRISPFDANKRRHTSFASVDITPEIDENDNNIVINPEDVRVDTYRSSGAGGQHINKTDSAIRITHFKTGIVVTCQNQRSQIQNKEMAFKVLKSKLLALAEEERQKNINDIKGELKKIEWGSQIRSYVFCPYTMVKDHRTNFETSDVNGVMDGEIKPFILDYLKKANK